MLLLAGCAATVVAPKSDSGPAGTKAGGGIWLGVVTSEMSQEQAASMGFHKGKGLLIRDVVLGGPMARAGLMPGDVLMALAGLRINSTEDLLDVTLKLQPGQTVSAVFARKGQIQQADVVVEARPAPRPTPPHAEAPAPPK
jgi:S1-C subfamily serine protease